METHFVLWEVGIENTNHASLYRQAFSVKNTIGSRKYKMRDFRLPLLRGPK